jgi:2-methylcitrate dehydratase PrpD
MKTDMGERLSEHVRTFDAHRLQPGTMERAKHLMLDALGAAFAATEADGIPELRALTERWGGAPEAGVIGSVGRMPSPNAALVNATMIRALELDDVHEVGLTHATATMLPVALAVAGQQPTTTGLELLTAIALGIDAGARLSMAPMTDLGGTTYSPRSMSRTYQTGVLAGSLVAARLAQLDAKTTCDAFGNAYNHAFGNLQGLAEGTLTIRVGQGLSAQAAIQAMEFARAGIGAPRQTLEGKYGWFQAFWGGQFDTEPLEQALGQRFEVDNVSIKPYACCKYAHTAIAAALELRAACSFDPTEIDRVVVHVFSRDCWDLLCEPLSLKSDPVALAGPQGWSLAQFSMPYAVACALARGGLTTDDLSQKNRTDIAVLSFLEKIEIVLEDTTRSLDELPEPGVVDIHLRDGTMRSATVRRPLGHPERPMSVAELIEKFRWCTSALTRGRVDGLIEVVLHVDELADLQPLESLLYASVR